MEPLAAFGIGIILATAAAVTFWPRKPAPQSPQQPSQAQLDAAYIREEAARLAMSAGLHPDYLDSLRSFADSLARKVVEGVTVKEVAMNRVRAWIDRYTGPNSADAYVRRLAKGE